MTNGERPILVFGATGRQGGSVAKALLKAGWPIRAVVRNPEGTTSRELQKSGIDVVQGSLAETDVIRAAMKDVYGVFSVLPANLVAEEEVRLGIAIADLTAASGAVHLVYSSGASVGEELTGVARFDAKPQIEAHIRSLPIASTIIRPAIFMEMLVRPGFGLDKGRLTSLIRPEQSMQLIAVDDIGKFVAAIFADLPRFSGETLTIASDIITGHELEAVLTEAAGRPITYARFPDEVLAANADLGHMAASLEDGPLAERVDLGLMREINSDILSFRTWLAGSGREAFDDALAPPAAQAALDDDT